MTYREAWVKFVCAALSKQYYSSSDAIAIADSILEILKERDESKFFDQPDKGYREKPNID